MMIHIPMIFLLWIVIYHRESQKSFLTELTLLHRRPSNSNRQECQSATLGPMQEENGPRSVF
jgi:hypothetical protein